MYRRWHQAFTDLRLNIFILNIFKLIYINKIQYTVDNIAIAQKKRLISVVGKWNLRSCLLPAKLVFVAKLVQIGVKLCEFWNFAGNRCSIVCCRLN